ncbi:MAG TPA: ABC transporter permease [Acidisoma sp.]|jgi:ribose transport system permease protein|uniref:ABC transporter permease n=1 Tax=Acidisoma sp. TaxID=1872115 RepID=UPI002B785CAB|nr:ABC transporter permease [Acidisoma sp.]HTI00604.1 ABC transporter permease [Acidisoma sp.]
MPVAGFRFGRYGALFGHQASAFGLVLLIALTWTAFAIAGSGFLGSFNLYSIGQLAARDAVLGMAQAMLIAAARMNLAVGGIGAVCTSLLGYLLVSAGVSLWIALPAVLAVGVLAALLMGFAELKTGLSSFVVTLAFLSIYSGGALLVTGGHQFQISSAALTALGNGTLLSPAVCPLVGLAIACGVLCWLLFARHSLGWQILSVGANERAARVSAVNVPLVVLAAYGFSGLLCGIACIMNASYELNVNAGFGADWLLPSFIAAVLGGVALTGGEISVVGILLAALFYDSLQSGLTIINVPSYWIEVPQGLVLLVAVMLDQARRRSSLRAGAALPKAQTAAASP